MSSLDFRPSLPTSAPRTTPGEGVTDRGGGRGVTVFAGRRASPPPGGPRADPATTHRHPPPGVPWAVVGEGAAVPLRRQYGPVPIKTGPLYDRTG